MNKRHEPRKDLTTTEEIGHPPPTPSPLHEPPRMLNSSDNRDKTALVAAVHNFRSLFAC